MLAIIAIILIVLWLGGFALHVGGGLIHILLVIGVIVLIVHFLRGRGV
ncbi:lmo0937 family membrane protein [Sphingomonas ginkgonis]|uniref:Lmo0937 family membrane protein n=1 Tax=Sphingomonas ginkgonis TaxID=2315330 RepID=A0A3R9YLX7_9SPHN|nr:lmo0937 family membrane protein [Sphingomonas ginkgonis]RST30708.1 lmo0937 family membrane protein [Sphingomonas ginkgonis]